MNEELSFLIYVTEKFSKLFSYLSSLEQVTIAPRAGRELGYVRMKMDHIKFKGGMLRYFAFHFLCPGFFKCCSYKYC